MKKEVTKAIGQDAINGGMITAGLMLGNISKLVPIENKLVKATIPLGIGIGATIGSNFITNDTVKKFVKPLGYGLFAYGFIALVRAALIGDSVTEEGAAGIAGVGDNPKVAKFVNMLLPNLGESTVTRSSFDDDDDLAFDVEEPEIEDIEAEVLEDLDDDGDGFSGLAGDGDDALEMLEGDDDDELDMLDGVDDELDMLEGPFSNDGGEFMQMSY